jgi:hypothetical protein
MSVLISGCALLPSKSNDDKLAKLSGQSFVISVAKPTLNLDLVLGKKSAEQSIYRLVSDEDYPLAFVSNGKRDTGPLAIEDPSNSILNGLNNYFQKKYQFRFVAKGTINNIDPAFIQKALKKGDYVVDVRVRDLRLTSNDQNKFYLTAAYQFTVINRTAGKNVLQDVCYFSEPENAQDLRYFSNQQGIRLSQALKRHATECLQYFAKGTEPTVRPTNTPTKPKPQTAKPNSAMDSYFEADVGGGITVYPNYPNELSSLVTTHAGVRLGKPLSDTTAFVLELHANASKLAGFPTFKSGTAYGTTGAVGVDFLPDSVRKHGYRVTANGQMGQFRQYGTQLSTNAIGLGIGVYRPLFSSIYANADYTLWLHVGATEESNRLGHGLDFSLSYRFD